MPNDPTSRPDDRPSGRGHPAAPEPPLTPERDQAPFSSSSQAPERPWPEQLLGWLRPTPAELVGLVLLVLGSVVATVVWWGQSVTAPAGVDQLRAAGPAVPSDPQADGASDGPSDRVAQGTAQGAADGARPSAAVAGGREPAPGGDAGEAGPSAVTVHVSGAVSRPGLVTLAAGGRVGDAVVAAGGLTDDADPDRVNLARALADGEHVHLPRIGEDPPEPVGPVAPHRPDAGDAAEGGGDEPLDLNRASATELEQLPGIGPARAAAIVEHRERQGPFAVPGDLRGVPGIGEATFQNLAPLVVVR